MAIRLPRIVSSKKVPKGYFAVYFGENQKRFVIPFRYSHPTGGLTIPCNEDTFLEVTSRMY
ncbi:hypothetical protein ES288_A03G243300v1 [Gossypium darwinii]|uniref:Uncharacterized protein n=1 Tax=Gossypium darwinii TaxID=34276 RepID=A0A5D2H7Z9_GOSDA|nr:hypothetical protein ES288_A03G243300v1 [Gossypium darwinii]